MLRSMILTIVVSFSGVAMAGSFDFLPAGTGAEQEFRGLMNAGNYKHALQTWPTAHQNSAFGESHNGIATYAYLLLQNGFPYFAFDLLINRTNPEHIDAGLMKVWEKEVKGSPWIQKGFIATKGGWRSMVNNEDVKVAIRNKKDIRAAFSKADRAPIEQINYKARIWWQIATLAPQLNEVDSALKAIKLLRESGQTVIGQDQVLSALGRALYQKGDLTAALNTYAQIPKGSMLWVESVEERAWAHLRQDDFDKALGEATTLLSPALSPLVGPESYFLANLLALKACDYPRVFKNSETFKKRHRTHLGELQALADTGSNKNLNTILSKFEQKGLDLEAIGPMVESIPRATFRDHQMIQYIEARKQILRELDQALKAGEVNEVLGENTLLAKTMGASKTKADRFKQQAVTRLRQLAKAELKEYRIILNKLHIVEAEVIQRLHVDDSLKGERGKLAKADDQGDVLVFPYNSDEVWFDELDNYKARVKDCPTLKGASL